MPQPTGFRTEARPPPPPPLAQSLTALRSADSEFSAGLGRLGLGDHPADRASLLNLADTDAFTLLEALAIPNRHISLDRRAPKRLELRLEGAQRALPPLALGSLASPLKLTCSLGALRTALGGPTADAVLGLLAQGCGKAGMATVRAAHGNAVVQAAVSYLVAQLLCTRQQARGRQQAALHDALGERLQAILQHDVVPTASAATILGQHTLLEPPDILAVALLDPEAYGWLAPRCQSIRPFIASVAQQEPEHREHNAPRDIVQKARAIGVLCCTLPSHGKTDRRDEMCRVLLDEVDACSVGQGAAVHRAALKAYCVVLATHDRMDWLGWALARLSSVDPDKIACTSLLGHAVASGNLAVTQRCLHAGASPYLRSEYLTSIGAGAKVRRAKLSSPGLLHLAAVAPWQTEAGRIALIDSLCKAGLHPGALAAFPEDSGRSGVSLQRTSPAIHALLTGHTKVAAHLLALEAHAAHDAPHTLLTMVERCATLLQQGQRAYDAGDFMAAELATMHSFEAFNILKHETACTSWDVHARQLENYLTDWFMVQATPHLDSARENYEAVPAFPRLLAEIAYMHLLAVPPDAQDAPMLEPPQAKSAIDAAQLVRARALLQGAQAALAAFRSRLARESQATTAATSSTAATSAQLAANDETFLQLTQQSLAQIGEDSFLACAGPLSHLVLRGNLKNLRTYLTHQRALSVEDLSHAFAFTFRESSPSSVDLDAALAELMRHELEACMSTPAHVVALAYVCVALGNATALTSVLRRANKKAIHLRMHPGHSKARLLFLAAERCGKAAPVLLAAIGESEPRSQLLASTDDAGDTPVHIAARGDTGALLAFLQRPQEAQRALATANVAGNTPLQEALSVQHVANVRALMRCRKLDARPELEGSALADLQPETLVCLLQSSHAHWPTQAWQSFWQLAALPTQMRPLITQEQARLSKEDAHVVAPASSESVGVTAALPFAVAARENEDLALQPQRTASFFTWLQAARRAGSFAARNALVETFLAEQAAGEDQAARNLEAWALLEALHIVSCGRDAGHHYAAHRPGVSLPALQRRCRLFRNYGSSRFGPQDGISLLQLRAEALASAFRLAREPLACLSINLFHPGLNGEGYIVDGTDGQLRHYAGSRWVRFVVRRGQAEGELDVLAMYPIEPRASARPGARPTWDRLPPR